jgi:hypothetical protein
MAGSIYSMGETSFNMKMDSPLKSSQEILIVNSYTSTDADPNTQAKARVNGENNTIINDSLEKESNSFTENNPDMKKTYQEFVKTLLKVKFENMHNSHKGQQISEKLLFKECIKRNIPRSEWQNFILDEFKNSNKYSDPKRDTKFKKINYAK